MSRHRASLVVSADRPSHYGMINPAVVPTRPKRS